MSTSRNRQTPINYMASGGAPNVLWELEPCEESDYAFHCGAEYARMLPPCSRL
jgi:hypothetical protein